MMPALLEGTNQFSTQQANLSRQVTMLRCNVEITNGQVKSRFKMFDHKVQNTYLPQLDVLFRIACSIHNHFGTRIREFPKNADKIVERLHQNMSLTNSLQNYIVEAKLRNKNVCWKDVNEDELAGFSQLNQDDVELIMLGSFQAKIGKQYTHQQMNTDAGYKFSIHKERTDLFRAKLAARFNKRMIHQIWIEVQDAAEPVDKIKSYFCTCKTGSRTVGSCAHVASVS
jgi:hypothetical protein